jgi:hypothetical protein
MCDKCFKRSGYAVEQALAAHGTKNCDECFTNVNCDSQPYHFVSDEDIIGAGGLHFGPLTPAPVQYVIGLRDYFAAAALTGICANPDISAESAKANMNPKLVRECYADSAYKTADAMLAERNKIPK